MKGILLKPELLRAAIEGRKTVDHQLDGLKEINECPDRWKVNKYASPYVSFERDDGEFLVIKPRYQVGETVYLQEAGVWDIKTGYRAYKENMPATQAKWVSPLFMPAWAARYFALIIGVSAGRVQSITPGDAVAEGAEYMPPGEPRVERLTVSQIVFASYWDSINPKYPWASDPWNLRYEFKLVPRPENV